VKLRGFCWTRNADPQEKRAALEAVPLNVMMVKHGVTKGILNAKGIRSDTGQPDTEGLRTSQGETDRGGNVEQAPPEERQPVAQGEEYAAKSASRARA